jgi:DNA polymerase-3 subunit beta
MTATAIETGLKVTVTREALRDGLRAVAGAVGKRGIVEVLKSFRLVAENGQLRISASDFDHWVTRIVPAEVHEDGVALLPVDTFTKLVDRLPPEVVRIAPTKGKGNRVEVRCGQVKSTFATLSPDEYPWRSEDHTERPSGRLTLSQLQALAHRTAFSVSEEDSRPILNGVKCEVGKGRFRMVATSGSMLSFAEIPMPSTTELDAIVRPETFVHVGRCLGADAEVDVWLGEHHITFRGSSGEVVSRVIEGPYPSYQQVIPRESTRSVVIDRAALLASVQRMVFVEGAYSKMTFAFDTDTATLSSKDADRGAVEDQIPCRLLGDSLSIAANAQNFVRVLERITTADVRLEMTTSERTIVIKPEGSPEPGEFFALIMPIRL